MKRITLNDYYYSIKQKEYMKERKRIQTYLCSMKKKGFHIDDFILPPIPDIITDNDILLLQLLTPARIRMDLYYISPYTGEYVGANMRKKLLRIRKQDKLFALSGMEKIYDKKDGGC